MRVVLGKFTRFSINHLGINLAAAVQAALLSYTRRLKSKWPPPGIPQFLRDQAPPDPEFSFELDVAPEMEAVLEREASRQKVPVDRILAHAVLVYLADLDTAPSKGPESHI